MTPAESLLDCPALGRTIDRGLCWECAFAGAGGPTDTAGDLLRWIRTSGRFRDLADFHAVCGRCRHCPWPGRDDRTPAG